MTSHSNKKKYAAILIVGAVALAVDRLVLTDGVSEPEKALALGSLQRQTGAVLPAAQAAATPIPELPFPRGLDEFVAGGAFRDLFAPPAAFSDPSGGNNSPDKDGAAGLGGADGGPASNAAFLARHSLDGVMIQQRLRIAVVDGIWVRIGDSVDGCTLKKVSGRAARFTCFDGDAVLHVARQLGSSSD